MKKNTILSLLTFLFLLGSPLSFSYGMEEKELFDYRSNAVAQKGDDKRNNTRTLSNLLSRKTIITKCTREETYDPNGKLLQVTQQAIREEDVGCLADPTIAMTLITACTLPTLLFITGFYWYV